MSQRIIIASDHGGYKLKTAIIKRFNNLGIEVEDLGTDNEDTPIDYPDLVAPLAKKVLANENNKGILICGTGIGMSISANKIKGIRAALCHNEFTAQMAAEHNNANILVLGGRVISIEYGQIIVDKWLQTTFENDERHLRRLEKVRQIEDSVL